MSEHTADILQMQIRDMNPAVCLVSHVQACVVQGERVRQLADVGMHEASVPIAQAQVL